MKILIDVGLYLVNPLLKMIVKLLTIKEGNKIKGPVYKQR